MIGTRNLDTNKTNLICHKFILLQTSQKNTYIQNKFYFYRSSKGSSFLTMECVCEVFRNFPSYRYAASSTHWGSFRTHQNFCCEKCLECSESYVNVYEKISTGNIFIQKNLMKRMLTFSRILNEIYGIIRAYYVYGGNRNIPPGRFLSLQNMPLTRTCSD